MPGRPLGRIEFKLYDDVVPRTAKNSRELATGEHGFGYAGSCFHRVVAGLLVQGGDITRRNVRLKGMRIDSNDLDKLTLRERFREPVANPSMTTSSTTRTSR